MTISTDVSAIDSVKDGKLAMQVGVRARKATTRPKAPKEPTLRKSSRKPVDVTEEKVEAPNGAGAIERLRIPSPEEIAADVRDFNADGFIHIRQAFSPEFVQELYAYFMEVNASYFEDKVFDDALRVGHKRNMHTINITGPFNRPAFYVNCRIMPVIRSLLGDQAILGSVGGVSSLPGAEIQHLHRDHPPLFGDGHPVNATLPPHAITVILPLVPLNAQNGTTRMYLGSHVVPDAIAVNRPTVDTYTELGDCMFMDYRLMHQGLANQTSSVRPILYLTYYRPWFRDFKNYYKQRPLNMSQEDFDLMPQEQRALVEWHFQEKGMRK